MPRNGDEMSKALYIAEKPSVAAEFAKALKLNTKRNDGYVEADNAIVTWCVGHLVTMSYPEVYDEALKKWSLNTLPFLPEKFLYEIIPDVSKQFEIVKKLLNREDVDCIYVCTDSGREGEYIYRLVEQEAHVEGKVRKRVWIDSQTEEEILRGIKEAKDLSEYDNLSSAAYLRAKEDYLMGINFSRLLTLKYSNSLMPYVNNKWKAIAVGRVMTCVLGMIVRREREIRDFVKTPFYRVMSPMKLEEFEFEAEWRSQEKSRYYMSPFLYKENGFKDKDKAEELIESLENVVNDGMRVESVEKKKETKNPPLLFNLAELQNECSKLFKISPDETLRITQDLYERKMVTYPRTDARVLSTAVAKEVHKNIGGLKNISIFKEYAEYVLENGKYKDLAKTRYVNDKQITDHYAIIPTGQGAGELSKLPQMSARVYGIIVRRFLSIFYPAAVYQKVNLMCAADCNNNTEMFYAGFKVLTDEGYLLVASPGKKDKSSDGENKEESAVDINVIDKLKKLKKGDILNCQQLYIKEGETTPPKRYNSGSIILAMENAGQLIEDEDLRAQIKGSGIGTSATRAEILKKLINNEYIKLNQKTQILTPSMVGEMIYDIVNNSIKSLLNPELTASWELGLTRVAEGTVTEEEYMEKLNGFVAKKVENVKQLNNQSQMKRYYDNIAKIYK